MFSSLMTVNAYFSTVERWILMHVGSSDKELPYPENPDPVYVCFMTTWLQDYVVVLYSDKEPFGDRCATRRVAKGRSHRGGKKCLS